MLATKEQSQGDISIRKHNLEPESDQSHAKRLKTEQSTEAHEPGVPNEITDEDDKLPDMDEPSTGSEPLMPCPGHGPLFRALPSHVQSQIGRMHRNLGHPDVRQFQHALVRSGWAPNVCQAVTDFHCDVCYEKQLPKIARPAHLGTVREFNDLVQFDGVEWNDGQGNTFQFIHFIDTATNFQIAIPFFQQTTESFMECFRNAWLRWAGSPKEVMFDSATGFNSETFAKFLQENNIKSHVIPPDAHWQLGRAERHGAILQRMLDKYHVDQPIQNWIDFEHALQFLCNAKNSLSRHAGYTPEILVLGKSQQVPGSNSSETDGAGLLDVDESSTEGVRFQQQLARREAARAAFIRADHCKALRKALHARSRPDRMTLAIGDYVMYWKSGRGVEHGSWNGPAKIIMLEQPNIVWISHLTRLFRCAPEHIRSVTQRELSDNREPAGEIPDVTTGVARFQRLTERPHVPAEPDGFVPEIVNPGTGHDTTNPPEGNSASEGQPDDEPEVNSNADAPVSPEDVPVPTDDELLAMATKDTWSIDQATSSDLEDRWELHGSRILIRRHVRPRLKRFLPSDCAYVPVPIEDIDVQRITIGTYRDCTKFQHTDVWKDNVEAHSSQPEIWTGSTWFRLRKSPTKAAEVHHTQTIHHAFQLEVILTADDIHKCAQKTYTQQEAFLASAAKRQKSEVKMHELSPEDFDLFKKAKIKEVESWLSTDTVRKIARNSIPENQLLRTRWVLTWKQIDSIEQKELGMDKKAKARLVILGFEDPFIDSLERDSPTLGRDSRMIALQAIASHQWPVRSFDIKTAFLRGSRQDGRILGIEPPAEMRELMHLQDNEACELLKGAYGLINAPLLWYTELKNALISLGFVMSPLDPCLFVLPKNQNAIASQPHEPRIHGVLGIHVDDGIGGGDTVFQAAINKLEARFPFGNKRQGNFTFTGINVSQQSNGDILLSQKEYIQDIPSIQISRDRRREGPSPITKDELQSFRGLIGSLQFAATNTRPDISCKLSMLQAKISNATVNDLLQGNRILEEAKKFSNTSIRIQSIPANDIHFMSFSDAAFATREKANSQKGCMILATTKQINEVQSTKVSPLTWYSKKIARVVASTLASETYALSGALDLLSWTRLHWAWVLDPSIRWQSPETTLPGLPKAFAIVDCKSLYDLLQKTSIPQCSEYRTMLEALVIRDRLREGVEVKWVHSAAQMADALTKDMDATTLRIFLSRGRCVLHDVDEILRQRSDKRLRNEWCTKSTSTLKDDDALCSECIVLMISS